MRYYDSLGDAGYPISGGLTREQDWQEHLDRGSLGGVDYAVGTGTPVIAPTRGVVENHTSSGPGNYVSFYHLDDAGNRTGFYDQFLHLSEFVSPGVYEPGATIGLSGNTGTQSSGPHIHWHAVNADGVRVRFWEYFHEDPIEPKENDMIAVRRSTDGAVFILGADYMHHCTGPEWKILAQVYTPRLDVDAAGLAAVMAAHNVPAGTQDVVMGGKSWSREVVIQQLVENGGGGGGATPAAIAKAVNDDVAKRMSS